MFRNSGKKIMGLVNFVFYLNLVLAILAVIAAAVIVFIETESVKWVLLAVLGGLLGGALYMVIVWLSLLCMYAFGELVQSSVDTKRILGEMQRSSERYSPQNYREPVQVTRSKPSIAERKSAPAAAAAPAPVAPVPVAPVPVAPVPVAPAPAAVEERPVQDIGTTETIMAPKEEPARPSFAYDHSPAGAPGFGVSDRSPRPLFCTKCGAKHEPGTAACRYCGTPLN